jgi:hypothetical protein
MLDSGYFRAKLLQEDLVRSSGLPYTILRSTQFFEFMTGIANSSTESQLVRLSPALVRPAAADDVAEALARIAVSLPLYRTAELAGPDEFRLCDVVGQVLAAHDDERLVIADRQAPYFGVQLNERTLLTAGATQYHPDRPRRLAVAEQPRALAATPAGAGLTMRYSAAPQTHQARWSNGRHPRTNAVAQVAPLSLHAFLERLAIATALGILLAVAASGVVLLLNAGTHAAGTGAVPVVQSRPASLYLDDPIIGRQASELFLDYLQTVIAKR